MAVFEIPLDAQDPAFTFFVDLDGSTFEFFFRWNTRTELWMFDVYDEAGEAVQLGNPLVLDFELLAQRQISSKWPGVLFASSTSGDVPDRWNIGGDIKLFYGEVV